MSISKSKRVNMILTKEITHGGKLIPAGSELKDVSASKAQWLINQGVAIESVTKTTAINEE